MKIIILLILSVFLLSGCFDYKELNDMSIVSSIGIDYNKGKYNVYLEITKSSKDGSSTEIETSLLTGESSNITDAFNNAKNKSDKLVYMEHVELLVLSKNIGDKGISEVLDYIIRDTTINNNYFMVICDNPNEMLSKKIDNKSASEVILNTMNYYLENTTLEDVDIVASHIINAKEDIALPYVYWEDENIGFEEIAYFNGDKIAGYINNKMYSFLKLDSLNTNFNYENNTINISKKKIDYEISDKVININIKAHGIIKEINDNVDLENSNSYKLIEKEINNVIKKETINFLENTLNNNSDLLGLKNLYYKKYKKNINNIKYKINVDLIINKNGTIYGVLNDN